MRNYQPFYVNRVRAVHGTDRPDEDTCHDVSEVDKVEEVVKMDV